MGVPEQLRALWPPGHHTLAAKRVRESPSASTVGYSVGYFRGDSSERSLQDYDSVDSRLVAQHRLNVEALRAKQHWLAELAPDSPKECKERI